MKIGFGKVFEKIHGKGRMANPDRLGKFFGDQLFVKHSLHRFLFSVFLAIMKHRMCGHCRI